MLRTKFIRRSIAFVSNRGLSTAPLTYRSHFVEDGPVHRLHLEEWVAESPSESGVVDSSGALKGNTSEGTLPAVLVLHGAIGNGKIFAKKSRGKGEHKGLAPFLARHGFRVFVADLRGRGKSIPSLASDHDHGQSEAIRETIPALHSAVQALSKQQHVIWISHSWGGVLMASAAAWQPSLMQDVPAQVHFGTKRDISVQYSHMWAYVKTICLGWFSVVPLLTLLHGGYFPAKKYKIGGDGETWRSLRASQKWVAMNSPWTDDSDGFDYGAAYEAAFSPKAGGASAPPTLHVCAEGDLVLGNPVDVDRWRRRTYQTDELVTLGTDFDHSSMLTDARCDGAHFQQVLQFLRKHASAS